MTKRSQFFRRLKSQLGLQIMVWPGVIFMVIFSYVPLYGLVIAFQHYTATDTLQTAAWVGMENFKIAFTDKLFWDAVINTLAMSFMKMLLCFPAPILLAILINEVRPGRLKKAMQTISYLPHFLSWIILGGMLITWLSPSGFFNSILLALGILKDPVHFMIVPEAYWWIAVLSDLWKEVGWGTILYLATMTSIDPTYYEAASIDGASRIKQIFYITLPLMKNIVCLQLILAVGGLLGSNLDQTLVLMNPLNAVKAEVINSYVYRIGLAQGDFSYATAVGLAISLVSLILVFGSNALTRKVNDTNVF